MVGEEMRERLKGLLRQALEADTQAQLDATLFEIQQLSPDPYILDCVFQSDRFFRPDGTLDVDGVVAKAWAFQPTRL